MLKNNNKKVANFNLCVNFATLFFLCQQIFSCDT